MSADTINGVEEQEIYFAIGHEGFERLVAASYRQVPGDDILGPIYRRMICAARNSGFGTFSSFDSAD
jgi:truncated hemoglobin YjbI